MRILRFILLASSKYVTHINNYSQYAIYYILITYSFYSFDPHQSFNPSPISASGNYKHVLCIYELGYTYIYIHTCICTYIYTHMHTHKYTHTCTYIYIYDVWAYFWIPYINGNIHYLCFWLISLSIVSLMSIPIITNGKIFLILCDWIIFHCICITSFLNLFIHWWMLKLFPDLGYCK